MPSSTVEDYLKQIYLESRRRGESLVPTGQIASSLGVVPATATAMVKTLAESGLVNYEPYSGVELTSAGRKLATHVVRRHRLIELFLVSVMGMSWSEVHEDAERLEHVVSDRLLERMDDMLGHPVIDPHGDPIPDMLGDVEEPDYQNLKGCELGDRVTVARVLNQRSEFLDLLETHNILPGATVIVVQRDEDAETIGVRSEDGDELTLGFPAASKILVEN